ADENLLAARRYPRPLHLVRAGDRDGGYAFEVRLHLVIANSGDDAFLENRIFEEGRSNLARAGLHRQADLEIRIRRGSRPGRGFQIGGKVEQLKPLIIEPEIELTIPIHSHDEFEPVPLQGHRNLIFGVDWETVANNGAPARADRRSFVA